MVKIRGIVPPLVTPLKEDETVDEKGLKDLINHCIEKGIHGIFVAGTNGEVMGLTRKEREKCIKIAIDTCRNKIPLLCGAIESSTKRVIEHIHRIEEMGGEFAVVTPAFYSSHSSRNEIISHYEKVALSTNMKIFIYNIPKFVGVHIKPEEVIELSKIENIIGFKDSSGLFMDFQKCLHYFENKPFSVLAGNSNLTGAAVLLGADGSVPSLAPLFPNQFVKLYESAANKDIEGTKKMQKIIYETGKILGMSKNQISANKYAMSTLGFFGSIVTSPHEPVTESEERQILKKIKEIKDMAF